MKDEYPPSILSQFHSICRRSVKLEDSLSFTLRLRMGHLAYCIESAAVSVGVARFRSGTADKLTEYDL